MYIFVPSGQLFGNLIVQTPSLRNSPYQPLALRPFREHTVGWHTCRYADIWLLRLFQECRCPRVPCPIPPRPFMYRPCSSSSVRPTEMGKRQNEKETTKTPKQRMLDAYAGTETNTVERQPGQNAPGINLPVELPVHDIRRVQKKKKRSRIMTWTNSTACCLSSQSPRAQ